MNCAIIWRKFYTIEPCNRILRAIYNTPFVQNHFKHIFAKLDCLWCLKDIETGKIVFKARSYKKVYEKEIELIEYRLLKELSTGQNNNEMNGGVSCVGH
jgi:hypothetical protein